MKKKNYLVLSLIVFLLGISKVSAYTYSKWNLEGESIYDKLMPYVEYELTNDINVMSYINSQCSSNECKQEKIHEKAENIFKPSKISFISNEEVDEDNYYLSIDLSKTGDDDVVVYLKKPSDKITELEIASKNRISLNTNSSDLFSGLSTLNTINGLTRLDTKEVTNMSGMFKNLSNIETLDLSSFITDKVTNTTEMFLNDNNLERIETSSLFNLDNVTNSLDMFKNCTSLQGENNTTYDENKTDKEGSIYFTHKEYYKDISDLDLNGLINASYTGNPIKPDITITYNGEKLKENKDYEVSLKNNINVGTATINVTGINEYIGTTSTSFKIKQATISSIPNLNEYTYTGSAIKPSIKFYVNGKQLVENRDYILTYNNNINPGLATVSVRGIGNYTGSSSKNFIIKPSGSKGLKATQTQSSIRLSWNKNNGVTGYEIHEFNYKKQKWEYKYTTTNTSYTINKLTVATIHRYKVRPYKTVNGTKYYGNFTLGFSTSTKTKTPSVKLTSKKKKVTVKWKKITNATGYEVYMSTKKNKGYKRVKITTAKSYTKTKLKRGKTYYFKARTYRTVGGIRIYGYYSSVKKIKVK